ncbi:MAG: hypothetical protein ACR2RB_14410 [Gammaproteobacteria bacterium]
MRKLSSLILIAATGALFGCSGDGADSSDRVVIQGEPSIAYVKRNAETLGNPTDGVIFSPGGDLYIRDVSSASAVARNITGEATGGAGDVSDPEVSYDGRRIIFSMRRPIDPTWSVWEFDIVGNSLERVITDDVLANEGDDVDPAYLPDGRIVFSSNRQEKSRQILVEEGTEPYAGLDEYEREEAISLHVMEPDGSDIRQISGNPSHDRNPAVLMSGQILFARWDHFANRNHFPLFTTDPDGANIFVQYGAFSPGNSYLHPREMPDGRVLSDLMPLSGTHEGGALMIVDVKNFSEINQPANANATGAGQVQATLGVTGGVEIPLGEDVSTKGRYSTPYPLWDGTNRALVSWTATPTVMETDPATGQQEAVEAPPCYGIYMLDLGAQTLRPVETPPFDNATEQCLVALTDPVAIAPRPLPNVISDKPNIVHNKDAAPAGSLAARGAGILNVKSVYDTDFLDIMGDSVLVAGESLPRNADGVADLATLKNPLLTTAAQRPARFVRIGKAVRTPSGISMEQIGESDFEMQQVIGYADVEPDGSIKIEVPADVPLSLSVLDAEGRAFQTHTNWLQVRPGETRTCNGCHSPRRGSALNSAPIAGNHPNTILAAQSGESMAETRTRLEPSALQLSESIAFTDVWTGGPDTLTRDYSQLTTAAPANGFINYAQHIQPLWDRACTSCHSGAAAAAELDLSSAAGAEGRVVSYDELMIGNPLLDDQGQPITTIDEDGEVMIEREAPMVMVGGSGNSSRSSHLIEKLYGQELRAEQPLLNPDPNNHQTLLNDSERFLVATWIDNGAQFINDPFVDVNANGLRERDEIVGGLKGLSEALFVDASGGASVHDELLSNCAGCHKPFGNTGSSPDTDDVNDMFSGNRFVLTGNPTGDFNVSTAMVNDVCTPEDNPILSRPSASGVPPSPVHPQAGGGSAVLATNSAAYGKILAWIDDARANNATCP